MADEVKSDRVYVKGWLVGFLFNFVLIIFIAFLGLFYITPNMLSKAFNTTISTGNKRLDNMALYELIPEVLDIVSAGGDVSIRELEARSGYIIPVEGQLLDELKDSKIKDLGTTIKDRLSTITLEDIKDIVDIGIAEGGLDLRYYLRDGVLYRDKEYSIPAEFDYIVAEDKVIISNIEVAGIDGQVTIGIQYIPITQLLDEIRYHLQDLTIGEVRAMGVLLPSILDNIAPDTKVTDTMTAILDLTIGDIAQEVDLHILSILNQDGKLKDINTNLSNAVMTKTIRELSEAGVIDIDADLDKTIPYINIKIGDLTIETMATYIKLLK